MKYIVSQIVLAQSTDSANVVLVDWSDWTQKLDYMEAVHQLPMVASHLVDWLNDLHDYRGVIKSFDDVTMVGHSLGAQLIGYVGHRLNGTVNRIIGAYDFLNLVTIGSYIDCN